MLLPATCWPNMSMTPPPFPYSKMAFVVEMFMTSRKNVIISRTVGKRDI
jgi:hypothetical protein